MAFLSGTQNILPQEKVLYNYWAVILSLLKIGIPYNVIMEFSHQEINTILGFEQAIAQREADERQRQQRISRNG
jgi:hypothetical protein